MEMTTDAQMAQLEAELRRVPPSGVTHDFREGRRGHRCCWDEALGHRKARFVGWSDPRPKPGDQFLRWGANGVEFNYVVVAVRLVDDPADMFYLDAIAAGYPSSKQVAKFAREVA